MKKIFSFIVLSFFIFASTGCALNQKKSWPKAPTREELEIIKKNLSAPLFPPTGQTTAKVELQSIIAPQEQLLKVYLKPSSVELCPDQQKQVLNWLKTIENFKNQKYIITGYADDNIDKKGKKDNQQYSLERAANGKTFLVKQGIPTLNIQYFGGGTDPANISQGKKRRIEISVMMIMKKRFDADIPLIPEPESSLAENDSRLIPLSETAKYPDWNKFPAGYNRVGSNLIVIGWKKIDDNTFDVIISVHESLIPEGATQFMPLGINEGWTKGTSVWPTPMWKETLNIQPTMFRRNIVCRDKNNRNLGYADINQAYRAGDTWAVRNSDIGMGKNNQDNSSCIGFFLGQNGLKSIP